MIYVNEKLYTFTPHFIEKNNERKIKIEWIEAVMENPTRYELSHSSGSYIYDGRIEGHANILRVVVDEAQNMIVTAYFVS